MVDQNAASCLMKTLLVIGFLGGILWMNYYFERKRQHERDHGAVLILGTGSEDGDIQAAEDMRAFMNR